MLFTLTTAGLNYYNQDREVVLAFSIFETIVGIKMLLENDEWEKTSALIDAYNIALAAKAYQRQQNALMLLLIGQNGTKLYFKVAKNISNFVTKFLNKRIISSI